MKKVDSSAVALELLVISDTFRVKWYPVESVILLESVCVWRSVISSPFVILDSGQWALLVSTALV